MATWEKTHAITVSDLAPWQVWRVWEDVANWHLWDEDISYARMDEPFAAGSRFVLKPKNGPEVRLRLLAVEPENSFTDVATFPLAKMYGIHAMRQTAEGLTVSHTVRVEGPLAFLWRRVVAEKVAAGLPAQSEALLRRAREASAHA